MAVATGKLMALDQGSGPGYIVRGVHVGRLNLGSGPDARKRGSINITTGVEGDYQITKALLDLGIYASKEVKFPLRMKVVLNGATVTREFKPQFICEGDQGKYAKAVYDVKPLAAARLKSRPRHRIVVFYDSSRIVSMDDAGLLIVYDVEGSWHSYVYMAGAVGFKPGEEIVVNAKLPESRTSSKSLQVGLVMPSRFAEIEVRVGNAVKTVTGIVGPVLIEMPIKVEGDKVRVSVDYRAASAHVYPRVAYLTSILIDEALAPRADLKLSVEKVNIGPRLIEFSVTLKNEGDTEPDKVILTVIAAGIPVARVEVDPIKPGEVKDVALRIDRSRIPADTSTAIVRLVWNNLGRVFVNEATANLLE